MANPGTWDKERRAPRAAVDDIVLLRREQSSESLIAALTDISRFGIGVGVEGLQQGERFSVSLAIGPAKRVVNCSAIVRHGNGSHHGLEFLDLSEEQLKVLAEASAIH